MLSQMRCQKIVILGLSWKLYKILAWSLRNTKIIVPSIAASKTISSSRCRVSISLVSDEPFPDRSRAHAMLTCTNGVSPNHIPVIIYQTMNHIVDMCPLTKVEGGLNLLHEADDDAVIWLEFTATAALAK